MCALRRQSRRSLMSSAAERAEKIESAIFSETFFLKIFRVDCDARYFSCQLLHRCVKSRGTRQRRAFWHFYISSAMLCKLNTRKSFIFFIFIFYIAAAVESAAGDANKYWIHRGWGSARSGRGPQRRRGASNGVADETRSTLVRSLAGS